VSHGRVSRCVTLGDGRRRRHWEQPNCRQTTHASGTGSMRAAAKRRLSDGVRAVCRSGAAAASPSPSTGRPECGADEIMQPKCDNQVSLLQLVTIEANGLVRSGGVSVHGKHYLHAAGPPTDSCLTPSTSSTVTWLLASGELHPTTVLQAHTQLVPQLADAVSADR